MSIYPSRLEAAAQKRPSGAMDRIAGNIRLIQQGWHMQVEPDKERLKRRLMTVMRREEVALLRAEFNCEQDHLLRPLPITRFGLVPQRFSITASEDDSGFTIVAMAGENRTGRRRSAGCEGGRSTSASWKTSERTLPEARRIRRGAFSKSCMPYLPAHKE